MTEANTESTGVLNDGKRAPRSRRHLVQWGKVASCVMSSSSVIGSAGHCSWRGNGGWHDDEAPAPRHKAVSGTIPAPGDGQMVVVRLGTLRGVGGWGAEAGPAQTEASPRFRRKGKQQKCMEWYSRPRSPTSNRPRRS